MYAIGYYDKLILKHFMLDGRGRLRLWKSLDAANEMCAVLNDDYGKLVYSPVPTTTEGN
jgi:hypothetical protein